MKIKIVFIIVQSFVLKSLAVHITSLGVPTSYILDENFCRPLILDCDYEFRPNDIGFVLKWYHNNHLIYQWIPPRRPYMFSISKYNINLGFAITEDERYKHRAVQLQPHQNLTGDWMCSVSTYHTRDRKIKAMTIIVPEKSFELYHHDMNFFLENSQVFLVICTVKNISPEPELTIIVDNNFKIISEAKSERDENGFFNKSIMARVDKNFIPSPSTINCILEINGTDYIKKKQFIYYDQKFDKKYSTKYEKFSMHSGTNIKAVWLSLVMWSSISVIIIIGGYIKVTSFVLV